MALLSAKSKVSNKKNEFIDLNFEGYSKIKVLLEAHDGG